MSKNRKRQDELALAWKGFRIAEDALKALPDTAGEPSHLLSARDYWYRRAMALSNGTPQQPAPVPEAVAEIHKLKEELKDPFADATILAEDNARLRARIKELEATPPPKRKPLDESEAYFLLGRALLAAAALGLVCLIANQAATAFHTLRDNQIRLEQAVEGLNSRYDRVLDGMAKILAKRQAEPRPGDAH